jgi:hypothetical protein
VVVALVQEWRRSTEVRFLTLLVSSDGKTSGHVGAGAARSSRIVSYTDPESSELSKSEDLLQRLKSLDENSGPRETLVELGAGVWANASM